MPLLSRAAQFLLAVNIENLLVYFLVAPAFVLAVALLTRDGRIGRKIRPHAPRPPGALRRELLNSVRSIFIFSLVALLLNATIYTLLPDWVAWQASFAYMKVPSLIGSLIAIVPMFLVQDTYFYWTHRLLHWGPLFRFHREHHRSHNPTPWTVYSFSCTEAAVQGVFVALYGALVPTRPETALLFGATALALNAIAHCGYELWPRWLVLQPVYGGFTGATHHDIHHATSRSNYGLILRFWDRIMGTEEPRFETIYSYVCSPRNDGGAYQAHLYGRPDRSGLLAEPDPR